LAESSNVCEEDSADSEPAIRVSLGDESQDPADIMQENDEVKVQASVEDKMHISRENSDETKTSNVLPNLSDDEHSLPRFEDGYVGVHDSLGANASSSGEVPPGQSTVSGAEARTEIEQLSAEEVGNSDMGEVNEVCTSGKEAECRTENKADFSAATQGEERELLVQRPRNSSDADGDIEDLKVKTSPSDKLPDVSGDDGEEEISAQGQTVSAPGIVHSSRSDVEDIWQMSPRELEAVMTEDTADITRKLKSFGSIESMNEDEAISDFLARQRALQNESVGEHDEPSSSGSEEEQSLAESSNVCEGDIVDDERIQSPCRAELMPGGSQDSVEIMEETDEVEAKAALSGLLSCDDNDNGEGASVRCAVYSVSEADSNDSEQEMFTPEGAPSEILERDTIVSDSEIDVYSGGEPVIVQLQDDAGICDVQNGEVAATGSDVKDTASLQKEGWGVERSEFSLDRIEMECTNEHYHIDSAHSSSDCQGIGLNTKVDRATENRMGVDDVESSSLEDEVANEDDLVQLFASPTLTNEPNPFIEVPSSGGSDSDSDAVSGNGPEQDAEPDEADLVNMFICQNLSNDNQSSAMPTELDMADGAASGQEDFGIPPSQHYEGVGNTDEREEEALSEPDDEDDLIRMFIQKESDLAEESVGDSEDAEENSEDGMPSSDSSGNSFAPHVAGEMAKDDSEDRVIGPWQSAGETYSPSVGDSEDADESSEDGMPDSSSPVDPYALHIAGEMAEDGCEERGIRPWESADETYSPSVGDPEDAEENSEEGTPGLDSPVDPSASHTAEERAKDGCKERGIGLRQSADETNAPVLDVGHATQVDQESIDTRNEGLYIVVVADVTPPDEDNRDGIASIYVRQEESAIDQANSSVSPDISDVSRVATQEDVHPPLLLGNEQKRHGPSLHNDIGASMGSKGGSAVSETLSGYSDMTTGNKSSSEVCESGEMVSKEETGSQQMSLSDSRFAEERTEDVATEALPMMPKNKEFIKEDEGVTCNEFEETIDPPRGNEGSFDESTKNEDNFGANAVCHDRCIDDRIPVQDGNNVRCEHADNEFELQSPTSQDVLKEDATAKGEELTTNADIEGSVQHESVELKELTSNADRVNEIASCDSVNNYEDNNIIADESKETSDGIIVIDEVKGETQSIPLDEKGAVFVLTGQVVMTESQGESEDARLDDKMTGNGTVCSGEDEIREGSEFDSFDEENTNVTGAISSGDNEIRTEHEVEVIGGNDNGGEIRAEFEEALDDKGTQVTATTSGEDETRTEIKDEDTQVTASSGKGEIRAEKKENTADETLVAGKGANVAAKPSEDEIRAEGKEENLDENNTMVTALSGEEEIETDSKDDANLKAPASFVGDEIRAEHEVEALDLDDQDIKATASSCEDEIRADSKDETLNDKDQMVMASLGEDEVRAESNRDEKLCKISSSGEDENREESKDEVYIVTEKLGENIRAGSKDEALYDQGTNAMASSGEDKIGADSNDETLDCKDTQGMVSSGKDESKEDKKVNETDSPGKDPTYNKTGDESKPSIFEDNTASSDRDHTNLGRIISGCQKEQSENDETQFMNTLESFAVSEYLSRFAPSEGLPAKDDDQLRYYCRKAARMVEKKVPIKDAARKILRASRKQGVPDTLIVKIFQCLKFAEERGGPAREKKSSREEVSPSTSSCPSRVVITKKTTPLSSVNNVQVPTTTGASSTAASANENALLGEGETGESSQPKPTLVLQQTNEGSGDNIAEEQDNKRRDRKERSSQTEAAKKNEGRDGRVEVKNKQEHADKETQHHAKASHPKLSQSLSEDSSVASATQIDFERKFGDMEEIDESEDIQAFLTRFKTLKEGGHFPDANVEALEDLGHEVDKDDADNIEVDLVHGFVKKDLLIAEKELTEEEKLWSEDPETDLYRKYSDFLKKMPVEVKKPDTDQIDTKSENETLGGLQKQQIAEMRDVNFGDAEVFLMEESVVEVAYVDEEEELRATEKSRNKEKWEFAKAFKKSMNRPGDVVRGRKVNQGDKTRVMPSAVVPVRSEKLDALEKMFEDRDEKIIRGLQSRNPQVAHWVSPWGKHQEHDMSTDTTITTMAEQPGAPAIDGVAAVAAMTTRSIRGNISTKPHWRRSYEERTKAHTGYFDVDYYSLYDSSVVIGEPHRLDAVSWEHRDVKQRFLHEKDIAFSRNWFGAFIKARGNDRNFEPVCHPRSMKMPIENVPDPGEWAEDWYTTWKSRKENPNNLKLFEREENMEESGDENDDQSVSSGSEDNFVREDQTDATKSGNNKYQEDDESFWEEEPEIGELCTVRLKIGERVSRVTWDHTSSLRRSRWRRKYFPKSQFTQS